MNVKIQGGGNGTYANTGSCVAVTNYLQHEDLERMKKGEEVQPFFNQFRDSAGACGSLAAVHPAGRDEKLCRGFRKRLEKR